MLRHKLAVCMLALVVGGATTGLQAGELRSLVDGAIRNDPEVAALTARRGEMLARHEAAQSLLPAPPAVSVGHLNDRAADDRGYLDFEAELGIPLWLPGEGSASEAVAWAELQRIDAEIAAQRLEVAGEVRDTYWAWRLAEKEVVVARARLKAAEALETDLARQVVSGLVARADLLLAQNDVLETRLRLREQELAVRSAVLALRALTDASPPASYSEDQPVGRDVDEHPRLVALRYRTVSAEAAMRLTRIQDRDNPELALVTVSEREDRDASFDTRFGVRVTFPFATQARNAPRRAAVQADYTQALAELYRARRRITADVEAADASVLTVRGQAYLAEERRGAVAEQAQLVERSFRVGEGPFAEVVRARARLSEAEIGRAESEIGVQRALSRLNQALGREP